MPWSTGRIDTYPGPPRRPWSNSHCRLRSTVEERSVSRKMRSTKSGPGRCSCAASIVVLRWLSSDSASSPSSSSRRDPVSTSVVTVRPPKESWLGLLMIGLGRVRRQMEHHFTGPSYTIGIEEELMIVDAGWLELVNAIESLLEDARREGHDGEPGEIKPELMESVLEIATRPAANTAEAGVQLRALRRQVRDVAALRAYTSASAGTHPFAFCEAPRIASRL